MKKFTFLFLILLFGCIERPYGEAYFVGEGDDIIEPEEDIIEPEEDVAEDTYEEDVIEDVVIPEEDIEEDTWVFDAMAEDVVLEEVEEDTWVPEETWEPPADTQVEETWQPPVDTAPEDTYQPPQDTYQPPQDTWTPPQDTYVPPKDTYQPPQDTNKPEDTKPQLGPGECPKDCKTWYNGCNTCQCNDGKIGGCTKMGCPTKKEPYCKKLHGT